MKILKHKIFTLSSHSNSRFARCISDARIYTRGVSMYANAKNNVKLTKFSIVFVRKKNCFGFKMNIRSSQCVQCTSQTQYIIQQMPQTHCSSFTSIEFDLLLLFLVSLDKTTTKKNCIDTLLRCSTPFYHLDEQAKKKFTKFFEMRRRKNM